jgi:hypothetical protein
MEAPSKPEKSEAQKKFEDLFGVEEDDAIIAV